MNLSTWSWAESTDWAVSVCAIRGTSAGQPGSRQRGQDPSSISQRQELHADAMRHGLLAFQSDLFKKKRSVSERLITCALNHCTSAQ
jgi:hypothetical protein